MVLPQMDDYSIPKIKINTIKNNDSNNIEESSNYFIYL